MILVDACAATAVGAAAAGNPRLFQKINTAETKSTESLGKSSSRSGVAFVDNSGSTYVRTYSTYLIYSIFFTPPNVCTN